MTGTEIRMPEISLELPLQYLALFRIKTSTSNIDGCAKRLA
jgi:hypothetical protein